MLYVLDLAEVSLDQIINKHNKINESNTFNKLTASKSIFKQTKIGQITLVKYVVRSKFSSTPFY